MIDLTPIFQAILALLAALITYKLIPWIKARTTNQQQMNLSAAARIAVYAAEQIFGSGHGQEKLNYALDALKRAGYDVNTELVRESIEDAVKFMVDKNALMAQSDPEDNQAEKAVTKPPEEQPPEEDIGLTD